MATARRSISVLTATIAIVAALAVGFGAGFLVRSATTTTTTTTTTTVPALTRCVGSQLSGTETPSGGAAGTITASFTVTNASGSACLLLGFPTLQMLGANGTPITTTPIPGGTQFSVPTANARPAAQRLAPGAHATFLVQYSDVPVGTETVCPTSATVNVYPPTSATSFNVAAQLQPCNAGTVHVSPFYGAT